MHPLVDRLVTLGVWQDSEPRAGQDRIRSEITDAVRVLEPLIPVSSGSLGVSSVIHWMNTATRRVLSLPSSGDLGAAHYQEALEAAKTAARKASAAGRARPTVTDVAVVALLSAGALSDATLVHDAVDGAAVGRSWSGRLGDGTRVNLAEVSRVRAGLAQDWLEEPGTRGPAPWTGQRVALLEARLAPQQAVGHEIRVAAWLGGRERWVDTAVLAELIRQDEQIFPADAKLLLAIPEAGAGLAQTIADSLKRHVWSPTAGLEPADDNYSGAPYFALATADPEREPWGNWLETPPGLGPPPGNSRAGMVLTDPTTGGSEFVSDSALRTYAMITGKDHDGAGHESIGHASFSPAEWARREASVPFLPSHRNYYLWDAATARAVAVRRVPWAGAAAAGVPVRLFSAHGSRTGQITWSLRDGRQMRGTSEDAGRWLARLWRLETQDQRTPQGTKALIVVQSCEQNPLPPDATADPLATVGPGQVFANTCVHRVVVCPTVTGTFSIPTASGSRWYPYVQAGFDGSLEGMRICDPEPDDSALDRLASAFGFTPDAYTPRDRLTVLRLVRALRITIPPADWNTPPPEQDPELAAGISALESLRHNDPVLSRFGVFTLGFLEHVIDAYARQRGRPPGEDRGKLCRDLLSSALQWWERSRDFDGPTNLTTILHLPGVPSTAAWWRDNGEDALIRRILRPGDPAPAGDGDQGSAVITEADRARAFWSLVRAGNAITRAAEVEAARGRSTDAEDHVARQTLHLAPEMPVDRTVRDRLRVRVAQALAQGYPDTRGPAAWAAWDLEHRGVLNAARPIHVDGNTWRGRSLAGRDVRNLDVSGIAAGTSADFTAPVPWQRQSFTLWEVASVSWSTVTLSLPAGPLETTHEALAHLAYADLERRGDTSQHIVLVGPVSHAFVALRLGRTFADITGRTAYIEPRGSELRPAGPDRHQIHARSGYDRPAYDTNWLTVHPDRPHFDPVGTGRLLASDGQQPADPPAPAEIPVSGDDTVTVTRMSGNDALPSFEDALSVGTTAEGRSVSADPLVDELLAAGVGQDDDRPWIDAAIQVLKGLVRPDPAGLWDPIETAEVTSPDPPNSENRLDIRRMPSVTRQVLSLPRSAGADEFADYREVLETVRQASASGRAGSLTDVAVVALERAGAWSEATLVRDADSDGIAGRSWSGRLTGGTRVNLANVSRVRGDGSGGWQEEPDAPGEAPWTGSPVAVLEARLSPQQNDSLQTWVKAELGGRERWVDTAVLAELIRQDEQGFPAAAELLLAVPEAGGRNAVLVRTLANSLKRPVWSPTAGLELTDDGAPPRLALASTDPDQEPWGRWLRTSPGPERLSEKYYEAGMKLTDVATGKPEWVPDSALRTYTMVTGTDHRSTGRTSHTPQEWAKREADYPMALHTEYYVTEPGKYGGPVAVRPAPWATAVAAGAPVYEFSAHGSRSGHVKWSLMDGRQMRGTSGQAGAYLRRRWSVRALDEQAPPGHKTLILLWVCEQQPLSAGNTGPLEQPGPGQIFSTTSGHRVIASPSSTGSFHVPWQISSNDLPLVGAGFDGSLPQMQIFAPEPDNDELAALAPAFGFTPGPAPYSWQDLMAVMRLVRALRITFPLTVQNAPTPEQDPELASGIGTLDRLRRDDPVLGRFGTFTLDFLVHATDAYARRHSRTSDDRRELCQDLLRWANQRGNNPSSLEAAAPTSLTTLLDMTEVTSAAAWWTACGGDALVQRMLRPKDSTPADDQEPSEVTETDRARAFWSLVRAGNAITRAAEAAAAEAAAGQVPGHGVPADGLELVARQVLHLSKKTPVDQQVHDRLRFQVTQALAQGYPDTASAAWAAWDLEVMGVLDIAEEIRTGAESVGWSLMGSKVQNLLTGDVAIKTSRNATLPEPWPSSFTVWEVGHIRQATVEVAVSGGYLMMPSHDALAHLIYMALDRERDAREEIVLIGTAENEQAALRLARTIADITGRTTHVKPGGSELRTNASRSWHLICAWSANPAATSTHWRAARPHRPHFHPVETSRPLTRAHPIGPDQDGRAFDLRVLKGGRNDLTVRVEFTSGPVPVPKEDRDAVWQRAVDGVRDMFNIPVRIIYKSRLHVTLERVGPGQDAHLTVELTGSEGSPPMSRTLWRADATPRELAVLIADQLGFDNVGAWPPDLEEIPRSDAVNYRDMVSHS